MQFDLFNQKKTDFLKTGTYSEFKAGLIESNCTQCPLHETRHHIVVDRGNPDAKVLMIGEAPGENEDLQGKAFVGKAGRLLDELLQNLGFNTNQDSLIINVVKCRPPENRQPKPEEAAQCRPFLKKQIDLVKPKIIVLLGATALKHIIPSKKDFSMNEEVGRFFEYEGYPGTKMMVLFHPAYILRDPRKKPLMIEHLKHLIEEWKKI